MFRVMIRDNMSPRAKEIMERTGKIEVVVDNDKATNDPQELSGLIGKFDGLEVRSGTRVKAEVLEKADHLKLIGRAGIGVDNIDVTAATARGIVVMNAPGGNTVTTGEHAFSLMLALARNIPQATASIRAGKWQKKEFMGVEIAGKTLGIVGLGSIGSRMAQIGMNGFKLKILACDPYITGDRAAQFGGKLVDLSTVMSESDIITLHTPLNEETRHMIGEKELRLMKPTANFINASRGPVVDEQALIKVLQEGKISGAGLDVFETEPLPKDSPLRQLENVVLVPHIGSAPGALRHMLDVSVENVLRVAKGQAPLRIQTPGTYYRSPKWNT